MQQQRLLSWPDGGWLLLLKMTTAISNSIPISILEVAEVDWDISFLSAMTAICWGQPLHLFLLLFLYLFRFLLTPDRICVRIANWDDSLKAWIWAIEVVVKSLSEVIACDRQVVKVKPLFLTWTRIFTLGT